MISIITITKNNPAGLAKTLDSVSRLTTCKELEQIIVNGGADEETDKIIASYRHQRLHVIRDLRPGIYKAMNRGVAKAAGDWLIFMNAGDCFASPDALNGFDPEPEAHLVFSKAIKVDGTEYSFMNSQWKWASMPTSHQSIFFKSELLRLRHYKTCFPIAGDFEYLLWADKQRLKCHLWNQVVAIIDNTGVSSVKLVRRVLQMYFISVSYFPFSRDVHHFYLRKLRWALKAQKALHLE